MKYSMIVLTFLFQGICAGRKPFLPLLSNFKASCMKKRSKNAIKIAEWDRLRAQMQTIMEGDRVLWDEELSEKEGYFEQDCRKAERIQEDYEM